MKKGFLLGVGLASAAAGLVLGRQRPGSLPRADASGGGPGTAIITGGSSGIGEAFARRLAALGYDLLLVARREDRLLELADELSPQHGIKVDILPADLSEPADIERVEQRIKEVDDLALLINNAGFGTRGRFARVDLNRQLAMVRLHVVAPMRFTRAALPGMIARHSGGIINVASVLAFFTLPGNVTYAATKAYLVSFVEGLAGELRGTGVRVQALCPGFTHTEFHGAQATEGDLARLPGFMWMPSGDVVDASLAALGRGDVVCVPGAGNWAITLLARTPPTSAAMRWLMVRVVVG